MSEQFNERKFMNSILIALGGVGISLLIGFIIIIVIEPTSTFQMINTLFFTPDIANYVNPIVVFLTTISLYVTPGPGFLIWIINIDPATFLNLVSGVLIASILTWTIIGFMIGFILRRPQKAMYQGLLTVFFSLIFTIIMEIVLVGNAGLLFTGPVGIALIGIVILLTIFFSLIMIVYCTVISVVAAIIANKLFPLNY
ncbi:MAG: hypothetical protein ACTSQO_11795 [Candidatus Helarchaeota archaeon]